MNANWHEDNEILTIWQISHKNSDRQFLNPAYSSTGRAERYTNETLRKPKDMVVTNQDVEQSKAQPCPPPKYPKEDSREVHRTVPGFSNRVQMLLVSEHVGQLFLQKQNLALSSFNERVVQEMGDRRPLFKILNKTPVCKKNQQIIQK